MILLVIPHLKLKSSSHNRLSQELFLLKIDWRFQQKPMCRFFNQIHHLHQISLIQPLPLEL